MEDLFIRRIYVYKGISIAVDIDLVSKEATLVEKTGSGDFKTKNWVFAERKLEYMNGWLLILDAMKHAITEAKKVLDEAEKRDHEKFTKTLMAVDDNASKLAKKVKKNA